MGDGYYPCDGCDKAFPREEVTRKDTLYFRAECYQFSDEEWDEIRAEEKFDELREESR